MFDILGPSVNFKINEFDRYKSPIGGLLTILLVVISTLAFVAFGRDIIEKSEPQVNYNKLLADDVKPVFYLTDKNFAFTFIHQNNGSYIDEVLRKFNLYLNVYDNYDGGYTDTLYRFNKCEKERLIQIKDQLKVPPEYYWCLPKNTTIKVEGVFPVGRFTSTRLNVDFCENQKTNRSDCYPKEQTRSTMGNIQMNIILDVYYTDSINYDHPFYTNYFSDNILTTGTTFSRAMIFFKTVEYFTDEGWILESLRKDTRNSLDTTTTTLIPNPSTNTIYSHMFVNSRWKEVYKRNYIKIQGIFAYIGGLISISMKILQILCSYLIFPDILKLFDEKFSHKEREQTNKIPGSFNERVRQRTVFVSPFKNKEITGSEIINLPINKNTEVGFFAEISKKKREFSYKLDHLTFCEKIRRPLCCHTKSFKLKISQFKIISRLYNKKISIENLTKLTRNFCFLRFLILESKHWQLLKYCDFRNQEIREKNQPFSKIISDLESKQNEPNPLINKKLLNYFKE